MHGIFSVPKGEGYHPSAGLMLQNFHKFVGLGTLSVILIRGGVEYGSVAVEDVSCRDRQFPSFIAIGKGKVDEAAAINRLLFIIYLVGQAELASDFVA